jgi:putative oxidoreductase
MRRMLEVTGRLALTGIFLKGGFDAFNEPGPRPSKVAELGLPDPEALVRFNGAAMMAGGAALALGILPRATAAGLLASLGATTAVGHPFWTIDDPQARAQQQTQFLKNLGIAGGLLLYAASASRRG